MDEAVAMVARFGRFSQAPRQAGLPRREHFFDGYLHNPEFAVTVLRAAEDNGAEALVLCDTNGGTLPFDVERIVADVVNRSETAVGIHCHNDCRVRVVGETRFAAVFGPGAVHVQGASTATGSGPGNADLAAAIPDLSPQSCASGTIPPERMERT